MRLTPVNINVTSRYRKKKPYVRLTVLQFSTRIYFAMRIITHYDGYKYILEATYTIR